MNKVAHCVFSLRTCHAAVGGVEIGLELVIALGDASLEQTRHREAAGRSTGAVGVEAAEDVGAAARLSVLHLDAPAAAHPAVLGLRHHNHLPTSSTSTAGVERLRQTVLAAHLVVCHTCGSA